MRAAARPENLVMMARFGISVEGALGVSMPELRSISKRAGRDHELALELWSTGVHEARILAALVADPALTDRATMEAWAAGFDSWDVCDQVSSELFARTPFAHEAMREWTLRPEEFVKRAGFVVMAAAAVHDKEAGDEAFLPLLALIEERSTDHRKYVRKAASWALRNIGKRNAHLNREAIATAESMLERDDPGTRWVASDALRELRSPPVQERLERRQKRRDLARGGKQRGGGA